MGEKAKRPLRCCRCRKPLTVAPVGRKRRYCSDRCRQAACRQRSRRSVHFRSDSCEWSTPQDFFDAQHQRFGFTLDVCASPENAKCPAFYTRADDGLARPWRGRVWCNPPYGRGIGEWVEKAWRSVESGEAEVVVCLVPSRTDTAWWHAWAMRAEIEYLCGRLSFGKGNAAPFPSALLVFRDTRRVTKSGVKAPVREDEEAA
jgi:phage N-6-adenine-methyltransferase